jgi:hypothetical protein
MIIHLNKKSKIMNKIITKLAIGISLLVFSNSRAQQWDVVEALPQTEFTTIKCMEGKIFAASENKLYISNDGSAWDVESIHPLTITPTCLMLFNNVLYVGTAANGVYYRNIQPGSSWNHALLGLQISSFIVHNGQLHISSRGSGVWKNVSGTWNNITYNLPTHSYDVQKIVSLHGKLYAFAGDNGAFFMYDPDSSLWYADYYYDSITPGLIIDDAIISENAIIVANGNSLLRSDDGGENWENDGIELVNGIKRILFKGAFNLYALTCESTNTTYFQMKNCNAESQSNWSSPEEILSFHANGVEEFKRKVFIASNQGVYYKQDDTLNVDIPESKLPIVTVYNSTETSGEITILCDSLIEKIDVFDLNGKWITSKSVNTNKETFRLSTKGIHIIKMMVGGQTITKKINII